MRRKQRQRLLFLANLLPFPAFRFTRAETLSLACNLSRAFCRPSLPASRGYKNRRQGRLSSRARALRVSRTSRPPARDPQRRAIYLRPDRRPRLLFPANLLRFRAFGFTRARTPTRAIGLRKQTIGKWRQAAAPNPSYLGTTRSLKMLCGFAAPKRRSRYNRANLHHHRQPETRVPPCLARKHRRHRLRPRRRPQRKIPDPEARHRRHVRRGRIKASGGHRKDTRGMSIISLGMAAHPGCTREDAEAGSAGPACRLAGLSTPCRA